MISDEKNTALLICRELFVTTKIQRVAAEQYEVLLAKADKYQRDGVISVDERNDLILEATRYYAHAVESLVRDGEQRSTTQARPIPV